MPLNVISFQLSKNTVASEDHNVLSFYYIWKVHLKKETWRAPQKPSVYFSLILFYSNSTFVLDKGQTFKDNLSTKITNYRCLQCQNFINASTISATLDKLFRELESTDATQIQPLEDFIQK